MQICELLEKLDQKERLYWAINELKLEPICLATMLRKLYTLLEQRNHKNCFTRIINKCEAAVLRDISDSSEHTDFESEMQLEHSLTQSNLKSITLSTYTYEHTPVEYQRSLGRKGASTIINC